MKSEFIIDRQGKLCDCGCGLPAPVARRSDRRAGVIKGQPHRFIRGHATRRCMPDYYVDANGCWIWQRGLSCGGYGQTGRGSDAHRVYYERFVGSIPPGLDFDHLCRNRACVNPTHLQPVPRDENRRRSPLVGRRAVHMRGRKLTAEQVRIIRRSRDSLRSLATQFGVSRETVRAVRTGCTYSEVSL